MMRQVATILGKTKKRRGEKSRSASGRKNASKGEETKDEPSSFLDLRLKHVTFSWHVDLSSKFSYLGQRRDRLHERIKSFPSETRDFDGRDVSSQVLENDSSSSETVLDVLLYTQPKRSRKG